MDTADNRVEVNREIQTEAKKALDELIVEMVKSRMSGTFGIEISIHQGRLSTVRRKQDVTLMRR